VEYRIKYTNIKHKLKSVVEMNLRCHCLLIPVFCDLMVKTCCPGDRLFSVASPPRVWNCQLRCIWWIKRNFIHLVTLRAWSIIHSVKKSQSSLDNTWQ